MAILGAYPIFRQTRIYILRTSRLFGVDDAKRHAMSVPFARILVLCWKALDLILEHPQSQTLIEVNGDNKP